MQQVPASPDAFVWLRLYSAQMHGLVPVGAGDPLWRTLRRPIRPLVYRRRLSDVCWANAALGANWTLSASARSPLGRQLDLQHPLQVRGRRRGGYVVGNYARVVLFMIRLGANRHEAEDAAQQAPGNGPPAGWTQPRTSPAGIPEPPPEHRPTSRRIETRQARPGRPPGSTNHRPATRPRHRQNRTPTSNIGRQATTTRRLSSKLRRRLRRRVGHGPNPPLERDAGVYRQDDTSGQPGGERGGLAAAHPPQVQAGLAGAGPHDRSASTRSVSSATVAVTSTVTARRRRRGPPRRRSARPRRRSSCLGSAGHLPATPARRRPRGATLRVHLPYRERKAC